MRKTGSGAAIICGVIRSLTPVAAVAAVVVGLGLGCGGDDEPAVCQSLQDLQASVQSLGDIELEDTSADELQQAANQIVTDANEAKDAADEELGQEIDTFKATVEALASDVETASAEGELTRDSLVEIGTAVGSVTTSFQTLQEAAPDDCDLE